MIRVLILHPGDRAEVVRIEPSTTTYENIIGGFVERLDIDDDPVRFYHNPTSPQRIPTVELRGKLDARTLHLRGVVVVVGVDGDQVTDVPDDVISGFLPEAAEGTDDGGAT